MCGLAGLVDPGSAATELSAGVQQMADRIMHRGPDDCGVWASSSYPIALAHRRLSILDLSPAGHQPMTSCSGESIIAYNGEIYNFDHLKNTFLPNTNSLRGHSDTEILLESIELCGVVRTLSEARGMFAFAYFDNIGGVLTLARDRIGEKPLYYGIVDGQLVFASELKSIYARFPASQLTLNYEALGQFLRYGYISAPQTIFSEIRKLPPGCTATVDLSTTGEQLTFDDITIAPYWRIEDHARTATINGKSEQAWVAEFDTLLNGVVEQQSVADVPLGAFLSGGIDSSLVAAVLQSQCDRKIDTFTIGFHEKEFNEAEHARRIAEHIGSQHHELYIDSADILQCVPRLTNIFDEPYANASSLPMLLVSQHARTNVTVCLSGDGGDELFCGYNRYFEGAKMASLASRIPRRLRQPLAYGAGLISPATYSRIYQSLYALRGKKAGANFGNKITKAIDCLSLDSAAEIYRYLCSYNQQPGGFLTQDIADTAFATPLAFSDNYTGAAAAWDQKWYLPGDNLAKTDRASMAVSLELRVPLLDRDIIEFSWRLPGEYKFRAGQSKWIMRQLLYRHVPREMIERPKMGFTVPVGQWIRDDLNDWAQDLLANDFLIQQGIFEPAAIQALLNTHLQGKTDCGNQLWTLLMFQEFYRNYMQ